MALSRPDGCRNCALTDVPANRAGRHVMSPQRWYNCLAPLPETPVAASCIIMTPPRRMVVWSTNGAGCPAWVGRKI